MTIILTSAEARKCLEAYAETLLPGFRAQLQTEIYNHELRIDLRVPDDVPDPDPVGAVS